MLQTHIELRRVLKQIWSWTQPVTIRKTLSPDGSPVRPLNETEDIPRGDDNVDQHIIGTEHSRGHRGFAQCLKENCVAVMNAEGLTEVRSGRPMQTPEANLALESPMINTEIHIDPPISSGWEKQAVPLSGVYKQPRTSFAINLGEIHPEFALSDDFPEQRVSFSTGTPQVFRYLPERVHRARYRLFEIFSSFLRGDRKYI